jgi:hypothetical protein
MTGDTPDGKVPDGVHLLLRAAAQPELKAGDQLNRTQSKDIADTGDCTQSNKSKASRQW